MLLLLSLRLRLAKLLFGFLIFLRSLHEVEVVEVIVQVVNIILGLRVGWDKNAAYDLDLLFIQSSSPILLGLHLFIIMARNVS